MHLFKRNDLLDPERFDHDVLERERLQLGPRHFSAQYLQEPTSPEGDVIRMNQLMRFERPIPIERFERVFQSWDTAASTEPTAAYSVCTTWGYLAGRIFLLHIYRGRVDLPTLRDMAIALQRRWSPDHVVIENASSGIGLIAELKRIKAFKVRPWRPSTGKVERAIAQAGQIEEGRVWLPASLDGLDTFLSELRNFPHSKYCDQVDSFVQALEFINHGWHFLAQEYMPSGRPVRSLRHGRPPFPPLPAFLQ